MSLFFPSPRARTWNLPPLVPLLWCSPIAAYRPCSPFVSPARKRRCRPASPSRLRNRHHCLSGRQPPTIPSNMSLLWCRSTPSPLHPHLVKIQTCSCMGHRGQPRCPLLPIVLDSTSPSQRGSNEWIDMNSPKF
jgi:hypothetical protein